MIDWGLVTKIAGGGYGMCILVLVILSLVAWIVGLIIRRTSRPKAESKEDSDKG